MVFPDMGAELYLILMNKLIEEIKKARFIWICGNGGSASTAEHFATDLVKKGYPAIALSSNTSLITMIANDYGFDRTFSYQLGIFGGSKDLLVTISCSGKSKNIKRAITEAKWMNMERYEFETFGKEKDYGKLEDKHLKFAHAVAATL